jgi:hypothetical protein
MPHGREEARFVSEAALPIRRPRSVATPVLFLVLVFFLEVTLFLGGLALGAEGDDVTVLLLALITVLVGAGPILANMIRPPEKRQMLILLVTGVYVVNLVLPVFTQYFLMKGEVVTGTFRLSKNPPEAIAHAQIVALVGLAMLLLGFYLPFGRVAAGVLPRPTRDWPPHAVLSLGLFTLTLGWLVYLSGQLGLIPARLGTGVVGIFASGSYFGIALLTLAWLQHRRREVLLLLAIVVPLSMLFNFFTGSKRLVLTPPFMVALSYIVYERRIRTSWLAAGVAALIVLYPVSEVYRAVVQTDNMRSILNFIRDPSRTFEAISIVREGADLESYVRTGIQSTTARLDALGVLTVILRETPERVPFQGGWTIGYVALSYVPRLLWANKPQMTQGDWVSQTYGSASDLQTDVGPSWVGEFYFNWGYAGVVLGMIVMGFLCRLLQERFFLWNGPIPALLAAVVALYSVCMSVQGTLMGPVNGTVYNLAPILFAHLLVGMTTGFHRRRADARSAHAGASLEAAGPRPAY